MSLVSFSELMSVAEDGNYAVGYFESWSLESLLAVADAAEATRFPGDPRLQRHLPAPSRTHRSRAAQPLRGTRARRLQTDQGPQLFAVQRVAPDLHRVLESVDAGFNLVMYADEEKTTEELVQPVRWTVAYAHARGAAVEAEMASPPGLGENLSASRSICT